jgi:hypothetical protein
LGGYPKNRNNEINKSPQDWLMLKNIWLIWCRTVDHRIGKTDDDEPNIPILTIKQAQLSLLIRSFILIVNLITCFFICTNIIHKW